MGTRKPNVRWPRVRKFFRVSINMSPHVIVVTSVYVDARFCLERRVRWMRAVPNLRK